MTHISSFVFFDLETTGLPYQERNQTKIIELSCVAALRQDIQSTFVGETPPVKKFTFVLNPQRPIHSFVTKLTGLTNEFLQHAPVFQQKIKSLISFLENLPKPVCLVAHNGNTFDYKILLAECNDAGTSLPKDLLCVDSLIGFRNLLKGTNINHSSLKLAEQSFIDDLLTDDEDDCPQINVCTEDDWPEINVSTKDDWPEINVSTEDDWPEINVSTEDDWPEINVSTEDWEEIDEICLSLSDMSCEDLSDAEQKAKITKQQKKNVKTSRSNAIRKVFGKKPEQAKEKKCFNLSAVYKRLLDKEESNAHRAEVDCLMLSQCVVALKNEFLPWADGACKLLTEIKPLIRY